MSITSINNTNSPTVDEPKDIESQLNLYEPENYEYEPIDWHT